MIILPVEIKCPECGVEPGATCVKPEHVAYGASYSFHLERIIEAKKLMETRSEER